MEEIREGFTRVSNVLNLYNNFDQIDPQVLQRACDRGTKVHNYAQLYAEESYFPTADSDIKPYVDSFIEWYDEMVDKVLLIEWRGYNDILRITGQIDLVAVLRGDKEPSIIDYKTSQVVSKSWNLQTAAYLHLYNESDNTPKAKRRIALQLSKEGKKPKIIEYTEQEKHFRIFKGILEAMRYYGH